MKLNLYLTINFILPKTLLLNGKHQHNMNIYVKPMKMVYISEYKEHFMIWFSLVQVAQQEAQRAVFVVERAKQERQQKIFQAEGEAEAAKMISFSPIK